MRIGVAREIKPDEHRVALTPRARANSCQKGHEVVVEQGRG
jgi:alanine dehydrogenase